MPRPSGLIFCLFSLVCGVVLGLFDFRADKILRRKEEKTAEKISVKDIKDFPLRVWIMFIICVAYYVTVFPFIGLATLVMAYPSRTPSPSPLNTLALPLTIHHSL